MQAPRVDTLTAFEASQIGDFVEDLTGDSTLNVSITYDAHTSRAINTESGKITDTEENESITVLRAHVSERAVTASGGMLKMGDRWYLIDADDLSQEPTTSDAITDGSDQLEVKWWKVDPTGAAYMIAARRV